jgi:D-beta-D-heptose 7-phosphate kinase/D-beta-D-heptose 1-phosphate adenosyltransferase
MKQEIYNNSTDSSLICDLFYNFKSLGKKIVFTNGCFDILHVGHLRYLKHAKSLGDILVVAINTDASVKKIKGPSRPIVPQTERAEMLLGLSCVDYIIYFDEETPLELIKLISPDYLVKGGDWSVDQIVGSDHVISSGGIAKSLPFEDGHSTTNIIEKILDSKGA